MKKSAIIVTSGGKRLDLFKPDPRALDIEDIVYGLSRTTRWNGQYARWVRPHIYSVAQHSVYVERTLRAFGHTPDVCYFGLMHDAAEAYFGDIITPLKRLYPEIEEAEYACREVIFERFGVPYSEDAAEHVKWADRAILHAEAAKIGSAARWVYFMEGPPPLDLKQIDPAFRVWDMDVANNAFSTAYQTYEQFRLQKAA